MVKKVVKMGENKSTIMVTKVTKKKMAELKVRRMRYEDLIVSLMNIINSFNSTFKLVKEVKESTKNRQLDSLFNNMVIEFTKHLDREELEVFEKLVVK